MRLLKRRIGKYELAIAVCEIYVRVLHPLDLATYPLDRIGAVYAAHPDDI